MNYTLCAKIRQYPPKGLEMNKSLTIVFLGCALTVPLFSQNTTRVEESVEELRAAFEGLSETIAESKTSLDAMKKIKLSGYLQAQYQIAESDGMQYRF